MKQKTIQAVIALLLCCTMLYPALSSPVNSEENQEEGSAVLLHENFFYAGNDKILSGWEVSSAGCFFHASTENGLYIKDSSTDDGMQLQKEFRSQQNSILTAETVFLRYGDVDVFFAMMDNDIPFIKIGIHGGDVGYCAADGSFVPLWQYTDTVRIRLEIDLQSKTYDLYKDGALAFRALPFFYHTSSANGVFFATSDAQTGEVYLRTVRVYTGYAVNDSFETSPLGTLPDGWTINNGIGQITSQTAHGARDSHVLQIRSDTANGAAATRTFAETEEKTVFDILACASDTQGMTVQFQNGSQALLTLSVQDGIFTYRTSDISQKMSYIGNRQTEIDITFRADTWYLFRVIYDPVNGKADLYANYKKVASDLTLPTSGIDSTVFLTPQSQNASLYLEDICVFAYNPLPEDYVPEPVVPEKSTDSVVGMQSCHLWQVGRHIGWEPNTYQSALDPLMGYYDEGSSEAQDWSIKYLVEHGVDFLFMTWNEHYDFNGSDPLVEPEYEFALDAYFYSEYSAYLNFAFQIYGPDYNLENFKNNIIPYFVQYYLNDPRYQIIDNRPVIGIGDPVGMANAMGGAQYVKEVISLFDQACVELGFDGAYFIGQYGGVHYSGLDLQTMEECGFDGAHWYSAGNLSWETIRDNNIANYESLKKSSVAWVPTVSVGWSAECWNLTSNNASDTRMNTDDFAQLCAWAAEYTDSLPDSTLSGKLVLVDNWNESAEGHSMTPTVKRGFGYLDGLGKAFTTTQDFSALNTVPTDTQKARMNLAFPKSWHGKVWDFDAGTNVTALWRPSGRISNLAADTHGHLQFTINKRSTNAYIYCQPNQYISSENDTILIRLQNNSNITEMKVYFKTDTENTFSEDKCLSVAMLPNDSTYYDYVLDASQNEKWTGTVTQIRIQFTADENSANGTFSIDTIRLLSDCTVEASPAIGQGVGKLHIPYSHTFLSPASYYSAPLYQVIHAGLSPDHAIGGDLNLNGTLDSNDLALLRASVLQWESAPDPAIAMQLGDLNGNGILDSNDYICLLSLIIKTA